ncbi:MAG: hypothetical protein E6J26_09910 [Chloroflexi bacterium]|nr:MAG: hypothetical protein E6J26_09910 [Chloroflexota bacterium]
MRALHRLGCASCSGRSRSVRSDCTPRAKVRQRRSAQRGNMPRVSLSTSSGSPMPASACKHSQTIRHNGERPLTSRWSNYKRLDNCTRRLDDVVQQATALQKRAAELTSRLVEARADVRAAQIEYERGQARGVGHLLDTAKAAGVEGAQPLQALYRVAPEHDRLVRGALGTGADALVVHKWTDAEQLAVQAATQQVILVLESFHDGQGAEPSTDVRPDVPLGQEVSQRNGCSAFDLIACAPEHRPLFESLLGPVSVGDGQGTRVNERGDLISAHALITSEASAPNLAVLQARLTECQYALQDLPAQVEQAQAEAAAATQQRDALGAQRYAVEAERVQAQAALAALVREREQHQREVRQLVSSLSHAQADQASLAQQVAAWDEEQAALRAKEPGFDAAGSDAAEANADELALSRQLAQQETRAALLNQQYLSHQQMLAQIEPRTQAIAAQRQQRTRRAEQLLEETGALRSELASVDAQLEQLGLRIEPLRAQAQPVGEQLTTDEAALGTLEAQERGAREALYGAEAAHSESLVDFQRRQDRLSTLREQIEGDYEFVSLATDLPTALALEIDETRVLRLPQVLELPDGMEQDIRSLKNKMRWIGNVNLEAPSEYALEKARLEFLQVQSTDLQRASESLQQLVAELEQMMQHKFRETFQAVARAFKEYFTKLFGGGSAELVLTEPENLIATGIDIIAHPPGKRRQPLGLLSGGERALTAAALIFALLKASPTPFCVLDEVDAALDEANIGRFRSTLQELAERTQFIVITHNRGTIEAAGTVYGISMGADGASQTLSLKRRKWVFLELETLVSSTEKSFRHAWLILANPSRARSAAPSRAFASRCARRPARLT